MSMGFGLIHDLPCMLCMYLGIADDTPAEMHHPLSGGRRIGKDVVLALCPPHHRGAPNVVGISQNRRAWEKYYGTNEEVLMKLQEKYIDRQKRKIFKEG